MHTRESLGVSERRSCRVIGQHRSTQRKWPQEKVDEELLTRDIIKLAREYGRYGYRRIAVLLKKLDGRSMPKELSVSGDVKG